MNKKLFDLIENVKKSFSEKFPLMNLMIEGSFSEARFCYVIRYRILDPDPKNYVTSEEGTLTVGYTHVSEDYTFEQIMEHLTLRANLLKDQNVKVNAFDDICSMIKDALERGVITKEELEKIFKELLGGKENENSEIED